eukprot:m.31114 g.31114  ORF g.31114 m.31114 type:complete len:78 (-) comp6897_c0_seq1:13-246(-)
MLIVRISYASEPDQPNCPVDNWSTRMEITFQTETTVALTSPVDLETLYEASAIDSPACLQRQSSPRLAGDTFNDRLQ